MMTTDTETDRAYETLRSGGDVVLKRAQAETVLALLLDAREASVILFTLDGGSTFSATRETFAERFDQMYGGADCGHWEIAIAPVAAVTGGKPWVEWEQPRCNWLPAVLAVTLYGGGVF